MFLKLGTQSHTCKWWVLCMYNNLIVSEQRFDWTSHIACLNIQSYNSFHHIHVWIWQVVAYEELPTLDSWLTSECELCPFDVHQEGHIEDSVPEAIEVRNVFTKKHLGNSGQMSLQCKIWITLWICIPWCCQNKKWYKVPNIIYFIAVRANLIVAFIIWGTYYCLASELDFQVMR